MREVIPIRHLKREDNARERSAKDGGHSRGSATDQHDAPVTRLQPQTAELRPEPGAYRRTSIDTRPFQRGASAKAYSRDRSDKLWQKGLHVNIALMLVVG